MPKFTYCQLQTSVWQDITLCVIILNICICINICSIFIILVRYWVTCCRVQMPVCSHIDIYSNWQQIYISVILYKHVFIQIHMRPDAGLSVWWDAYLCFVWYRPMNIWIQTYVYDLGDCAIIHASKRHLETALHWKCESNVNKKVLLNKETKGKIYVHYTEMIVIIWDVNQSFT